MNFKRIKIEQLISVTKRPKGFRASEDIAFVPMDLIPIGKLKLRSAVIRKKEDVSSGVYVENGDLLISKITPCFENGKQCILSINSSWAIATTEVIPVKTKSDLDINFLFYWLYFPEIRNSLITRMQGSTGRRRLGVSTLMETYIDLPELNTQRKIAYILSTLQKRIEQIDKKIELYKQLKRSMMEKLFTEGLRGEKQKMTKVGLIPESWGIKTLADLTIRSFSGGTPSTSRQDYWNGTIKWITSKTLVESSVSFQGHDRLISEEAVAGSATHIAKKGTLLVASRVGLGKVAVTNFDVAINQDIAGYEVNDEQIQADFLAWQILTDRIQRSILSSSRGATIKGVTRGALNDLMIGLPSKLEQKEIVYSLSTLEKHLTIIKNKKNIYNQIFRNLLDSMMTQKISVENITFEYQNEV